MGEWIRKPAVVEAVQSVPGNIDCMKEMLSLIKKHRPGHPYPAVRSVVNLEDPNREIDLEYNAWLETFIPYSGGKDLATKLYATEWLVYENGSFNTMSDETFSETFGKVGDPT